MFEQYHIVQLLEKYNYNVELITGKVNKNDWDIKTNSNIYPKDVIKEWYVSDELAKEYGYTHLISQSKRKKELEEKVANRLYKETGDTKINVNGYYPSEGIGVKNI